MEKNKDLVEMLKSEENVKAVEELVESGKRESEALVEVASKLGYEVTAEELAKAFAGAKELDDEELETVSGGIFFFGDDAPDGHEIGCILTYYSSMADYESVKKTRRCIELHTHHMVCEFNVN